MNPRLSVSAVAARYRGVQVATCSPVQLLVMMYDGVLRFVHEADAALGRRDRARVGDRIGKALAILEELSATLDPSQAPELCENLLGLYTFSRERLLEANLHQDPARLADVLAVLTPLREAFFTLASAAKPPP